MSDAAAELVRTLVELDSTNPQLVPGGAGEGPVAAYLARRLEAAGLELDVWDVLPGRPNVVATLRGTGGGKTLMLCGHTDVVRGSDEQFRADLRDGRLYGRGSIDMKGGIAAAVLAAERLAQGPRPPGDLVLALVVDEEWLSVGAEALIGRYAPDAAIFPEPSNLNVVVEHGGFAWFEVESRGVEAAGGDTDLGRDAIAMLGPVLGEIRTLDRDFATRPAPDWGRASIHASTITGGDQLPVYPATCTVGIERCLIPGETWRGAEDEMRQMLARARAADPELDATLRTIVGRDPIAIPRDAPVAQVLLAAFEAELGHAPVVRGEIGWMDSGILFESGVPCLTFGPVGAGEHTATEWVDIGSVETCAKVLERAAREFCSSPR
ncbi:MAG TPA: M20/M25/M40 family metallo-hydrolase [Gaiellales bacterium]